MRKILNLRDKHAKKRDKAMHQLVHELELVKIALLFLFHTIAFSKAFTCNLYHSLIVEMCANIECQQQQACLRELNGVEKVMECFHIAVATDFDFNSAVVKKGIFIPSRKRDPNSLASKRKHVYSVEDMTALVNV